MPKRDELKLKDYLLLLFFYVGFTYTRSSVSFASHYRLNAERFEIANNLDAGVRYTHWQCIAG
ncbi:hypothetical protein SAMN06265375_1011614 [Muriicola jejuensis]|nr:hypothetical protein SAMN06265375_1011614 [Muriicola jejuensis]